MAIMSKPFKTDKEIEDEEDQSIRFQNRFPQHQRTWHFVYGESEISTPVIIDDSEIIDSLVNRIKELEEQVASLQKKEAEYRIQSLLEQNDTGRKELEEIFGLDENKTIDTRTLDGMLSEYVIPTENADEMVRSVRDNY